MKWLVVLCLLASDAVAAARWTITTHSGDTVALDVTRTSTGYRAVLHERQFLHQRMWNAVPCPGNGEQQAGETLLELDRQRDGTFAVKLYKGRMYTAGPNGMGNDPVTACVFDAPLTYTGTFVNRAGATAVDRTQVDRFPRGHDSFLALRYTGAACPVPPANKRTCGGIWPFNPIVAIEMLDTDEDGIFDEWEISGIRDGTSWLDLKTMGANPDHKDLFIQMDATEHAVYPDDAQLAIIDYLATLPVTNPDGRPGITLHLDAGPDSYMVGDTTWGTHSRANRQLSIGDVITTASGASGCESPDRAPVDRLMQTNLEPLRARVFRYAIASKWVVANQECYSGMNWNIPSKAFVIGDWASAGLAAPDILVGLFLHELGHSLGLRHAGGTDEPMYKPNYQSVMNYLYQEFGVPRRGRRTDYGVYAYSTANPTNANAIDETRLADRTGLPAVAAPNTDMRFACAGTTEPRLTTVSPGQAADFKCDGNRTSTAPQDITFTNGDSPATLDTFNDVAHLQLPLSDGPSTIGAGKPLSETRGLPQALRDWGVQIGDRKNPTVKLTVKKKAGKRQVVIKAADDRGLASAVVTSGSTTKVVMLGKKGKMTKTATATVDVELTGDISVVVTDATDKSATAATK